MQKVMHFKTILIVSITVLLIGCNQKDNDSKNNQFSGLWTVYAMEKQDSVTGEWNKWRDGMQGYVLYDEKDNMSIHLTSKGYQDTDLQFPNFNDSIPIEALKHLTNSYVYFAKYTIDEEQNIIEHARISHSNPSMWNELVRRRFAFNGDTLTLQPIEKRIAGLRIRLIRNSEARKE